MDLVAATQEAQAKNEWLTKRDVVDVLVYCLRPRVRLRVLEGPVLGGVREVLPRAGGVAS